MPKTLLVTFVTMFYGVATSQRESFADFMAHCACSVLAFTVKWRHVSKQGVHNVQEVAVSLPSYETVQSLSLLTSGSAVRSCVTGFAFISPPPWCASPSAKSGFFITVPPLSLLDPQWAEVRPQVS